MKNRLPTWLSWWVAVLGLGTAVAAAPVEGQGGRSLAHCASAERFLSEELQMVARSEPDTISDWRTGGPVPGCRITAAGITTNDPADEVKRFYERVRDAGWSRTPDPRDAPNEGAVRFRHEGSDCLFNLYHAGYLGTPADIEVSSAVIPGPGESRYNVFVMCTPAMDARKRSQFPQQT